VDDAGGVRNRQRVGDLEHDVQPLRGRGVTFPDPRVERRPSISSIARKGWPSSVPASKTATMCAWLRAEAARASRSNREPSSGSLAYDAGSSFRATSRSRRVSRAR